MKESKACYKEKKEKKVVYLDNEPNIGKAVSLLHMQGLKNSLKGLHVFTPHV